MTEKMKPSGIAWIGDIPYKWSCKQIAFMTDSRSGGTPDRNNLSYWENGTIPWMSSGEVNKVNVYETDEKITELATRNSSAKIVKANAVMVALNGQGKTKGMSAILRIDSACNQSLCAFSCHECTLHYEYLFWCFQTMYTYLRQMSGDDVRDGLAASYVKKQKIPVPEYKEQRAIANFLDAQCAKIDRVIADIEKQIETLQKYKKSLITEMVTKGLDRSVPMMDSGIEWIGKIPAHWGTNRLRYVASVKTGPFGTQLSADEYVDEGVPIINVKNIGYGSILAEDLDFVPESVADRLSIHRLKPDDIVFGRKGAVDKHAIITDEYVNWVQGSDCIRVRSNPEINSGYLNYLFDSTYFGSYVMLYAVGATMPSMSSDILLNARILVPPIQEQRDIAAYLDKQCGKINAIITNKQAQLDTIRSHKKSLIYEYVTGKKRVTEVN